MQKPTILWVDLTARGSQKSLRLLLAKNFNVTAVSKARLTGSDTLRNQPTILCFEYDYPSYLDLKLLQSTKLNYSAFPIFMFTQQHSEALALWAFRSGVWDCLTLPIAEPEYQRLEKELHGLSGKLSNSQVTRSSIDRQAEVPNSLRFHGDTKESYNLMSAVSLLTDQPTRNISGEQLAKRCNMSPSKFSRLFKRTFNTTFQDYVSILRIRESLPLLRNPHASIAEVAYAVGFHDPSYFTRAFRRRTGIKPSDYRSQQDPTLEQELAASLQIPALH